MGDVWLADDEVLHRHVAVKFLRDEFADDEHFRERLRREARSAGSISHTGVVPVYDYGEIARDNAPFLAFIVMEYVDGPSLAAELLHGPMTSDRALLVIEQTAAALQAAHDAGVIHRDIKPGNILVTPAGDVKLTDFGISHAADSMPITRTGVLTGTAKYFSPEQAAGQQATTASDVYSLGVVAYACLAGDVPFADGNDVSIGLAHLRQRPPELPYDVPTAVRDLVMAMLDKDPQSRPPSAGAVASTAAALRTSPGESHPFPPTLVAPTIDRTTVDQPETIVVTPVRSRRWLKTAAVAVTALLIAAIAATWVLSRGQSVPSVLGKQRSAAEATLERAGLKAKFTATDAPGSKAGVVLKQSPAPGVDVDDGATIVVTIASGKVGVPRALTGSTYEAAAAALRELGLEPRRLVKASSQPAGTVIDVSPVGRVEDGATVTLTVAIAPPAKVNPKGKAGKNKGKKHR